jgi:hypothetical protein
MTGSLQMQGLGGDERGGGVVVRNGNRSSTKMT